MRQLLSWRTWAAIGVLLVLITAVQLVTGRGPSRNGPSVVVRAQVRDDPAPSTGKVDSDDRLIEKVFDGIHSPRVRDQRLAALIN